ncbi:MAG: leucine-rich repeat protein [Clostridia bacterium]|nr:leucine-rich repeat protein [Clostridia bacterium]
MSKTIKKALSILLCAALLFGAAPLNGFVGLELPSLSSLFAWIAHAADQTSGTCGENLTWVYDPNTFTLTISGTGAMDDYSYVSLDNSLVTTAPWKPYYNTMETVVINSGVTHIGNYAFQKCTALTGVTLPDSLTSIGYNAFMHCSALTGIQFPNSLVSIGDGAFQDCTHLDNLSIPDSVTSVGAYAFNQTAYYNDADNWQDHVYYCGKFALSSFFPSNVETCVIRPGTTVIAESAVDDAYQKITSLTIPESVTHISVRAFSRLTKLTEIHYNAANVADLPASTNAFLQAGKDAAGITVTFGASVERIPANLFRYETMKGVSPIGATPNITTVYLGGSVTVIGAYAFSGCSTITDVYFAGSRSQWNSLSVGSNNAYLLGANIHFTCTSPLFGVCGENMTWEYDPNTFTLTISGTGAMNDYTAIGNVTSAPWGTYSDEITSIVIGHGVTSVGSYAFYGCSALTAVTVPASMMSLGNYAVGGCASFTDLYYEGTQQQMAAATIASGNEILRLVNLHFIAPSAVSGTCGDDLYWTYDPSTHALSISGTGDMDNYSTSSSVTTAPWGAYSGTMQTAAIGSGVTSVGDDAFAGCSALTSVSLPNSVTKIGSSAFEGCSGLTGVTLPDNLSTINMHTFAGCTGLTSVTVPASVKYISYRAFAGCTALAGVSIPDNVIYLDRTAFDNTALYLDESNWQNNVFYIGNNLIKARTELTGVCQIKPGTKTIAAYAFEHCTSLTGVVIPDSVTNLGQGAFNGCTALTSAVVGVGATSITAAVFMSCTGLTNVTLGDDVTYIGQSTFYGCSALTSITIPSGVTKIDKSAFQGCSNLTDVYYPGTQQEWDAIIIGANNDPLLNAALHVNYLPVDSGTCGTNLTWEYNPNTFTLTISGTGAMTDYAHTSIDDILVTSAPWGVYYNVMSTVVIGNSVTSIGSFAFSNCRALTNLSIGSNVTSIGEFAFHGCTGLADVALPNSVTTLGSGAFYGCSDLTNVSIPERVTCLGNGVFYDCIRLANITIPDSVSSVGANIVYNTQFRDYEGNWQNGVLYVGSHLLEARATLQGVYEIEPGTICIADGAFRDCIDLTGVIIPDSVSYIGGFAFQNCAALTGLVLPESITRIGECMFDGCIGLTEITIPANVKYIGDFAFSGCTGLTCITVPDGVTHIGDYAFSGCEALACLSVPASLAYVGIYAFYYCGELTDVYYRGTQEQWDALTSDPDRFNNGNDELLNAILFFSADLLTSGSCGNNLTWHYDADTAELTISGTGAMTDYTHSLINYGMNYYKLADLTDAPWKAYHRSISSVVIGSSVTGIGSAAFTGCTALTSVTIPIGVTTIGEDAFLDCPAVADVYYGGTQQQWRAITIGEDNEDLTNASLHFLGHTHVYTSAVTKEPTCTEEGVTTYTCECGESYTEAIPMLAHIPVTMVTVPETCTETGLQHEECEVCGARLGEDVVIPAHGHTASGWQMVEDPTPTSTGRMCQYCTECHIQLDEMTVPMLSGTHVTGVTLSSSEAYLNMGETLTLTAEVTPATAANKTVLWTSSKPMVATVENGVVTPVAPGITVIIAQTADCGYKDFCVVQVNAVSAQNGLVIDNGTIYGLSVNMSSLDEYLTLNDDTMILETSSDVIGTGTKITVKQGDTVVNEFEAVVFGDIDGNAWYDGTDAYFVRLVANGMISESALTDAQRMAADCNHDGVIDSADVALLEQAGLLLSSVDQTLPSEELQTNSVYLEYCSLIDQSIEIAEPDQPAVTEEPAEEQESAATVWQIILDLFKRLVNFITMMFSIVVLPK